jgi:hypothetical protein
MWRKVMNIEQQPCSPQLRKQPCHDEKVRWSVDVDNAIGAARCGRDEHERGQYGEGQILKDDAAEMSATAVA